ncbi:MAG TPA: hypothetical protein VII43_05030 [Opitutaceae bacterium]
MPLTSIQSAIARLIAVNRSPSSHLAGAAALYVGPNSTRSSADLDYFHDREAQVGQAFAADRKILEESGYRVDVVLSQPGFVRAIVGRAGDSTKVEWAHDSSWRFLPPIPDPVVGFRLHPLDLSINKVLALAGRDEPRDFLDVLFVHRTYLSLGSLCWAAVGKDPGYGPQMLVEMLARKGRFRPDDFAGLDLAAPPRMEELKREWLQALADARRLVQELPAGDVGCLYWDPSAKAFVDPAGDLTRLVRHFGSDGGILPSIGEAPAIAKGGIPRLPTAEEPRSAYRSHPAKPKAKARSRRAKP